MDNKNYYELFDWSAANLDNHLKDKITKILMTIPRDVQNIIDIGCGDGTITNQLGKKFDVIAVDRSKNALNFVKTKRLRSSSDEIGVASNKFDLVFSSEVLEHLTDDIFEATVSEIKRLTRRYIYLTFPNNENIEKNYIKCPQCSFIFNRSYHLRKINLKFIKGLFSEFEVVNAFEFGTKIRGYNLFLGRIKHALSPAESWIPKFWINPAQVATLCPSCNHKFMINPKFHPVGFICDAFNTFLSPKKPYQLFIIMKRKTES
ncbi:MAG: class I SAM-dependent methyltransferase [Calditrichaceae bacterium]